MDFLTSLIFFSALSSARSAKDVKQQVYNRRIKKAKAFSRRRMARLSLAEQAEFDLPPYLDLLSDKFGIHEGTARMVAQETGFFAHKGGLICQQTAPLYQKNHSKPFDEAYPSQLAQQYKLPSFETGGILHTCRELWYSLSLGTIFTEWKDPSFRPVKHCREFIETSLREGTLYPLMNWCGLTEKSGSIQRAMALFGVPLNPIFPIFLEELSRRNMGFAEGTAFPL